MDTPFNPPGAAIPTRQRAQPAPLTHDAWLPESYAFAAMEFKGFAEMLDREGLALSRDQRHELHQLVDFYERKAVTQ